MDPECLRNIFTSDQRRRGPLRASASSRFRRLNIAPITTRAELHHPLDYIPCPNVLLCRDSTCTSRGTLLCSGCKVVLYCSKSCQTQHWKIHKSFCRQELNNLAWTPAFMRSGSIRVPSFISNESERESMIALNQEEKPFGRGISLWGNMLAMDILCLEQNEGVEYSSPLSIAFAASGDLRNVVQTLNSLSENYTGRLEILMNDRDGFVTIRNVLLLLVLGCIHDKRRASDIAIHLWYSAFLPTDYEAEIFGLIDAFCASAQAGGTRIQLTDTTTLSCDIAPGCYKLLEMCKQSTYTRSDAKSEIERIRFAPSRVDYLHRELYPLRPAHRLAFLHFRKEGILLPCGAATDAFVSPNRFLFLPSGDWALSDGSNPLEAWPIQTFINIGASHGARPEDLYGCLYFYLSDTLTKFANRLTRMKVSIMVQNEDAVRLAATLSMKARFDRVDVSNIMDKNYLGIDLVVKAWGERLSESPHSALLGYFMNWRAFDDAAAAPPGNGYTRLRDQLVKEGKVPPVPAAMICYLEGPTAVYDNARIFERYLKKEGLDTCLASAKLRRRKAHKISPHRLNAPLSSSPHDLPRFETPEEWYLNAYVGGALWTERFIEIERKR